jgi:hypothetical protein
MHRGLLGGPYAIASPGDFLTPSPPAEKATARIEYAATTEAEAETLIDPEIVAVCYKRAAIRNERRTAVASPRNCHSVRK